MSKNKSIRYEFADDIRRRVIDLVQTLPEFNHLKGKTDDISCIRSFGSGSRGTIARCHGMSKVLQMSLGRKHSFYVLEFISERFDRLTNNDQIKTMIHELMHVPKTFGGGFKHHDWVTESNVDRFFRNYVGLKSSRERITNY